MNFLKSILAFLKLHMSLFWLIGGLFFSLINFIHPFVFSEFIVTGIFGISLIFRLYEIEEKKLAAAALSSANTPNIPAA